MTIRDIKAVISPFQTIWVNENNTSDLYLTSDDIPEEIEQKEVTYMCVNTCNEIVLEI